MGQAHARLGAADPRLNPVGKFDFRLGSLLQAWAKADAPPQRVKPLPLPVVAQVWAMAQGEGTPHAIAAASCLITGFFSFYALANTLTTLQNGAPTCFASRTFNSGSARERSTTSRAQPLTLLRQLSCP